MAVEILGLPVPMASIPEETRAWQEWHEQALAYRTLMRARCDTDAGARREAIAAATADPLYDLLVFGSIFEPRARINPDGSPRAAGWYPWIPYEFQGRMIRWIEETMAAVPGTEAALLGRGDGLLEKARGMAGSWTFCGYIANQWKFGDGFVAGAMSYKEDLVEKTNSTDSLFYKIEGTLGLDARVPQVRAMRVGDTDVYVPVRSPDWMIPQGFEPRHHNQELTLSHPERTNVINGYSTGERTGVGGRASLMFMDEAAKFPAFLAVWNSMSAVTDHRFACSSADIRFGTGFRDLARSAEEAAKRGTPGPNFLRLRPDEHPERDSVWREEIEARHSNLLAAEASLAREYDLDYEAGAGSRIYPSADSIVPKPLSFNPAIQSLDFCIDPGIRDMTAFHLVSYDPGTHTYGLLASYANNGKPAEFYASLVMASPLGAYHYSEEEDRIMEWFDRFGKRIRYWVGDPAGKNRGGGRATSFYDDFRIATAELTDGRRPISIWSSDKAQYKWLQPRMSALRWLLTILEVNDAPDTRATLSALRDHRFKEEILDRETTVINAEPVRTWGHDRVVALEYYASQRKHGSAAGVTKAVEPFRLTAGGSPWNARKKPLREQWRR